MSNDETGASVRARIPYESIVRRRALRLPGDARVAVWTIVNVENWSPAGPMPRAVLPPPMGAPLLPDIPNWAWHEYGMRVGFWRFVETLASRGLKATFAVNGSACEVYREACVTARDAGWEFMGHGFVQGAMHLLPDQRVAIRQSVELLQKFTGKKPKGWLGPGLTETWETLDHLRAEGIEYVSDWVNDDQPYEIRTQSGPLVSVPYSIELNDIPMMVVQHHTSSEWLQRCKDQFDRLYAEGAKNPRVMAMAVHPYISGVPHRIKYFEAVYDYMRKKPGVWMTTGEEIYEWYRQSRR